MNQALLPARLGASWLLFDGAVVREVLGPVPWVPLPGGPSGFPGVLAWAGRAIAVCDLASLLDAGGTPLERGQKRARTLIMALGTDLVALPVDGAREAFSPEGTKRGGADAGHQAYVSELLEVEGTWMARIDIARLLEDVRRGSRDS
jgi:chemotaxis signal transduction protein